MSTTIRHTTTAERAEAHDAGGVVVQPTDCLADYAAWIRHVETAPGASIFHHPDWSTAVACVFGHRPLHLRATRGPQTVGLLPLMEVNSFLGGRMHISVPYGTYGGLLADDEEVVAALTVAATRQAEQRRARVLDLRSAQAAAPGLEPVDGYLGFVRDLPTHPNDVPAFLPKRARAAARHARDRDGVTVRHDNSLAPLAWRLYCRSMRRIASVNYPWRFFAELIERFGERVWTSVAWLDKRPVAGTISLVFRGTVMPYVLGLDERVRCDGAANLLYWSVMERAVRGSLRRFDYGRSRTDNKGAVGFKKNQGFEPSPLGYQRWVPAGTRAPDLRPSNPKYAVARRVWKHLPVPVSRVLGAWLAKWIPG